MLIWLVGVVSGLIFTGTWPQLPPWQVALLLSAFSLVAWRKRTPVALAASGLACGCVLGLLYGLGLLHNRLSDECVGIPLTVTGWVSSLPRESRMLQGGRSQQFKFSVESLTPAACHGPATLVLSYYGDNTIRPGDNWRFPVRLKKPWGLANPGVFNMQEWYARERIDGTGSVRSSAPAEYLAPATGLTAIHHRLRLKIIGHINRLDLTPDVSAILRAVTVADKSGIDHSLWLVFQQFGINHLLVISGLHVGIIAGVGYVVGGLGQRGCYRLGLKGQWMPGVCAISVAFIYSALAGFSLPTQRALCMLACFILADLVGRRSGSSRNLLLAAAVVLLINPLAALGSGFWLSFGAVATLLWLGRWQGGMKRSTRLLRTHGFMSLIMVPAGALFFGGASLIAMPANLLMIPLLGFVVVPLALLAAVVSLSGWHDVEWLWLWAGWPFEQLLPWGRVVANLRSEWVYQPLSGGMSQVVLGILAVVLLIPPGNLKSRFLVMTLALPLLLPLRPSSALPDLNTEVIVLDVGQGTAVVVRSGKHTLLYDTGGGDPMAVNMGLKVVLPFLKTRGINELDTMIISHPDTDHSAGTDVILKHHRVNRFRYGGKKTTAGIGRACIAGESWDWPGGQKFQFLSPASELLEQSNNNSCVLQIQVGDYRLLLPGDIQGKRERDLVQYWVDDLASDWLLVPHHGSQTSSVPSLLKRVRPKLAVVSSGYASRFGHPHPKVVQRLEAGQTQIWSTAEHGALTLELAPGKTPRVVAYRLQIRRYWM